MIKKSQRQNVSHFFVPSSLTWEYWWKDLRILKKPLVFIKKCFSYALTTLMRMCVSLILNSALVTSKGLFSIAMKVLRKRMISKMLMFVLTLCYVWKGTSKINMMMTNRQGKRLIWLRGLELMIIIPNCISTTWIMRLLRKREIIRNSQVIYCDFFWKFILKFFYFWLEKMMVMGQKIKDILNAEPTNVQALIVLGVVLAENG